MTSSIVKEIFSLDDATLDYKIEQIKSKWNTVRENLGYSNADMVCLNYHLCPTESFRLGLYRYFSVNASFCEKIIDRLSKNKVKFTIACDYLRELILYEDVKRCRESYPSAREISHV